MLNFKEVISVPDGYNGHTVHCYAVPVERDGNLVKLRVAVPGSEYLSRWISEIDWRIAVSSLKVKR